jgi:hypothetical protein
MSERAAGASARPSAPYRINKPAILSELFEDEAVAVNFDTGSYYGMSGAAMELWRLLENGASAESAAQWLGHAFDAPVDVIAEAVAGFLTRLCEEGLIVEADGASIGPLPPAAGNARMAWRPPELTVFEDMQDLLLLDPVHDVDDTGWPARKRAVETDS